MSSPNSPKLPKKIQLLWNKEILAALLVTIVVWMAVKKLLENNTPVEETYLNAIARCEIEPLVHELSEDRVDEIINAENNVWKRRLFIERALKRLLWFKR